MNKGSGSRISRAAAGPSSPLQARDGGGGLDHRDRPAPSASPAPSHGSPTQATSTPTPPARAQGGGRGILGSPRGSKAVGGQRECLKPSTPPSQQALLTELIGDTSILDDLFRPKHRTTEQNRSLKPPPAQTTTGAPSHPATHPPASHPAPNPPPPSPSAASTHTSPTSSKHTSRRVTASTHTLTTPSPSPERSKGRRKDLWEILSEGDQESIDRLTDLAEVERVCGSTKVSGSRGGEERGSAPLWKKNDKFLWKQ